MDEEKQQLIAALPLSDAAAISLEQVEQLSSIHLQLQLRHPPHATSKVNVSSGYVHDLLRGSSLYVPPSPSKPRDPRFLRFLQQQKIKQEQREYQQLSKGIPGNCRHAGQTHTSTSRRHPGSWCHSVRVCRVVADWSPSSSPASSVASASREMSHGVNILTLMVTGFGVCYYAGMMFAPDSKLAPVIGGLIGLISALIIEVTLLMIREGRRDSLETQRQADRQRERQAAQAEADSKRRIREAEAKMREILNDMNKQTADKSDRGAQSSQAGIDAASVTR